ncbi:MAG TPA: hypothetical protein VK053_16220 [Jiangellaceae bacterium]|nr:hypothetical protein [Jiangellaceae bacterium]
MSDNALAWRPVTRMRMHEKALGQVEERIVQGPLLPRLRREHITTFYRDVPLPQ